MVKNNCIVCPCCGRKIAIVEDESALKWLVFYNIPS